jgi:hypothetical protein
MLIKIEAFCTKNEDFVHQSKQELVDSVDTTVKLGIKELLNKEQIGNSEPVSVTNLPVYFINSEQIGISEQFCDDQKVP